MSLKNEGFVNFQNDRIEVDASIWPYSLNGRIHVTYTLKNNSKCEGNGTGFLIGDDVLLTAAHNFFYYNRDNDYSNSINKLERVQVKNIRVYFGKESNCNFKQKDYYEYSIFVESLITHPDYIDNPKSENDYAILILKTRVGEQIGFYELMAYPYFKMNN